MINQNFKLFKKFSKLQVKNSSSKQDFIFEQTLSIFIFKQLTLKKKK